MARYKRQVTSIGNIGVAQGVTAGTEAAQGVAQDLVNLGQTVGNQAYQQLTQERKLEDENTILNMYRDIQPSINEQIQEAHLNIAEDQSAFEDRMLTIRGTFDGAIDKQISGLDINDRRKEAIATSLRQNFDNKLNPILTARKNALLDNNKANILNNAEHNFSTNLIIGFENQDMAKMSWSEVSKFYEDQLGLYYSTIKSGGAAINGKTRNSLFQSYGKEVWNRYVTSLPMEERLMFVAMADGKTNKTIINGKEVTVEDFAKTTGANIQSLEDMSNKIKQLINEEATTMTAYDYIQELRKGETTEYNYKNAKVDDAVDKIVNTTYDSIQEQEQAFTAGLDLFRNIGMVDGNDYQQFIDKANDDPSGNLWKIIVTETQSLITKGAKFDANNPIVNEDGTETIATRMNGQPLKYINNAQELMETVIAKYKAHTYLADEESSWKTFATYMANEDDNRFLQSPSVILSEKMQYETDSQRDKNIGTLLNENPIKFFDQLGIGFKQGELDALVGPTIGKKTAHEFFIQKFTSQLQLLAAKNNGKINGKIAQKAARNTRSAFRDEFKLNPKYHSGWVHESAMITNKFSNKHIRTELLNYFSKNQIFANSYLDQNIKNDIAKNGINLKNLVFVEVGTQIHDADIPEDLHYVDNNGLNITSYPIHETVYTVGYTDDTTNMFRPISNNGGYKGTPPGTPYLITISNEGDVKRYNNYINAKKQADRFNELRKIMDIQGTVYQWDSR